jgi:hypothetical protein
LLEKREEIRGKGKTIPATMEYLDFTLRPSPFAAQV